MDPCLFHFVRKGIKHGRVVTDNMRAILDEPEISQAWVSIHTDDLDSVGTDDQILGPITVARLNSSKEYNLRDSPAYDQYQRT